MSGHRVLHDALVAPLESYDPGASGTITVTKNFELYELVSAAAETRTLAAPTRGGIYCIIRMKTDGGDITMTAAATLNVAANNTAVFADVGDQLVLISVSASSGYRWEIVVNTGSVALSTV